MPTSPDSFGDDIKRRDCRNQVFINYSGALGISRVFFGLGAHYQRAQRLIRGQPLRVSKGLTDRFRNSREGNYHFLRWRALLCRGVCDMKRHASVRGNSHVVAGPRPHHNLLSTSVLVQAPFMTEPDLVSGPVRASTGVEETQPHAPADESARVLVESLARSIEAEVKSFVARELHDQVVQTLTTTLLDMERFKAEQFGRSGVQTELALLQDAIRSALNQIRNLLYDLRDHPSADADFVESVQDSLIAVFERRTGIRVTLSVAPSWPAVLSPRAAMNLHRAIQEALNNVMLHAGAGAVHIKLDVSSDGEAVVAIEDDGRGLAEHPRHGGPQGLLGMTERAVLLGGKLSISSEPGKGTTVRLMVPAAGLA